MAFSKIEVTMAFLQVIGCLLISLQAITSSEELHDVWHHDHVTTKVFKSNPRAKIGASSDSAPSNTTTKKLPIASQEPIEASNNKTIVSKAKLINLEIDLSDASDEVAMLDEVETGARVCNFGGQEVRIAVSPQAPFVNCLQDLYGDWNCNGSNIEVVHVLERQLNFRARWVVLANGNHEEEPLGQRNSQAIRQRWSLGRLTQAKAATQDEQSSKKSPHSSSNILNLLATGRALMSANGFMQMLDRSSEQVIVSRPFDAFKMHFLLSKSVRDHDHIFLKPFDSQAWLAILSAAALIVPIFYFINTTSSHYSIQDDRELRKISLWQCVKWKLGRAFKRAGQLISHRKRRLSSISSSLFDRELAQLSLQLKNDTSIGGLFGRDDEKNAYSGRNPLALIPMAPPQGESKRRRRLAKHQWLFERHKALKTGRHNRKSGFFKLAYVIWYVVVSLANQGGETEDLPQANSTRILIAFWWLYMIVVCAIHSGILTAILTFPKQSDFIQTLDDYLKLELSERNSLRLAVDKFSELAHLLTNFDNLHKSPLQVLQNLSVPIAYVNFQRHRQRILDDIQLGHSALMEEKSTINQIISQEYFDSQQVKCLFKSSRYAIDVIPMSLILSKQMPSKCVRKIDKILDVIMRMGLAQKWRRNFEAPGNDCLETIAINAGDVDKIELKQVKLAFWLLGAGLLIGLLFLVGEIGWLFMVDDDDDDGASQISDQDTLSMSDFFSSSSDDTSGASSDSDDRVRLGFKRALMPSSEQFESIRSLTNKRMPVRAMLRKNRRQTRRKPIPRITLSASAYASGASEEDEEEGSSQASRFNESAPRIVVVVDEREGLKELRAIRARHLEERRAQRLARGAKRRARRIERAVDLIKRLHGGQIYSTSKLTSGMRRMSRSVMSHLPLHSHSSDNQNTELPQLGQEPAPVMRRRTRHRLSVKVSPL